jgi:cyclopropane-fatty-acyl-phospholipid synthase
LGFGENYVNKNIEVTGNLKDLLYLENFIKKNNIKVPVKTKLAIAVNKLSNINSKKGR